MAQAVQFNHDQARAARLICGAAGVSVATTAAMAPALLSHGAYGALATAGLTVTSLGLSAWAAPHFGRMGPVAEYTIRRKYWAVVRERRLTVTDQKGRVVYPRLTHLVAGGGILHGRIRPLYGQSVADWEKASAAFALVFNVPVVRFRVNDDGSLQLLAGYQRLEVREATMEPAGGRELPTGVTWGEVLATVPVGITEGGQPYAVPFLGGHILCAGRTGAGKGSVAWSLLLGLLPAIRAGVVRCWCVDPKRVEMAIGWGFFGDRYAATDQQAVELLERMAGEMGAVGDQLAGAARKIKPSPDQQVNVLVIDELAYLSALMPDRKLRDRAEKALNSILVLGRALGYIVVGLLQDPRKETLPNRDLWPVTIGLRLPKGMVDLVLGAGMYEAGAVCDQIPPQTAGGAGTGFVVSEDSGLPVMVRFTWCSDELIKKAAASLGGGAAGSPAPLPIGA